MNKKRSENDLLISLNNYFENQGMTNTSYNLPIPDATIFNSLLTHSSEIDPDARTFFETNHRLLNEEQKSLF